MKPFLIITIGVLLLLLSGCMSIHPVCRHRAIYCAVTAAEQMPVRIAVGVTTKSGMRHAQAQGFIDGRWRYLGVSITDIVIIRLPESEFTVDEYVTAEEYWTSVYEQEKCIRAAALDELLDELEEK